MTGREEAKELITQMVDAYNRKDLEEISSRYADDIRLWSAIGPDTRGKSAAVAHLSELFTTLPDEQMTLDTIVADEKTVVIEVTSRGTDPQGASYEIAFTEVFRVDDNLVREIRTYIDPDDIAHVGE